jgi:uncharacterized protein (TIGR02466 family)
MDKVIGLFPIPVLRAQEAVPTPLVTRLIAAFSTAAVLANSESGHLAHTTMLRPQEDPLLLEVNALLAPKLSEFGALMLGEKQEWSIKEMWVNVLDNGGQQAMHNHANSFISGIVYLTSTHASATTVFLKDLGGADFRFRNNHDGVQFGPFNADQWTSTVSAPGDVTLFPSYLLHKVPPNEGGRRITLSFNAIPTRMDSWGYRVAFTA